MMCIIGAKYVYGCVRMDGSTSRKSPSQHAAGVLSLMTSSTLTGVGRDAESARPGPTAGLRQTELVARLATSPGWTSDRGVEASSARTRGHSRVTVWYMLPA